MSDWKRSGTFYVIVKAGGGWSSIRPVRVTQKRPSLQRDERAIKMTVTVPNELFETSMPEVAFDVPAEKLIGPEVEVHDA